jgi:hypothetical protein
LPVGRSALVDSDMVVVLEGRNHMRMRSLLQDPKHWRARAAEARAVAELMDDPIAKSTMMNIAEEYEDLARRSEIRAEDETN